MWSPSRMSAADVHPGYLTFWWISSRRRWLMISISVFAHVVLTSWSQLSLRPEHNECILMPPPAPPPPPRRLTVLVCTELCCTLVPAHYGGLRTSPRFRLVLQPCMLECADWMGHHVKVHVHPMEESCICPSVSEDFCTCQTTLPHTRHPSTFSEKEMLSCVWARSCLSWGVQKHPDQAPRKRLAATNSPSINASSIGLPSERGVWVGPHPPFLLSAVSTWRGLLVFFQNLTDDDTHPVH